MTPAPGPSLQRIAPGPDRDRHLPLLLLADDLAADYLHDGDLWLWGEGLGAVLTLPFHQPATVELRAVAVDERHQGRGTGRAMVAAVLAASDGQGCQRAVVGTGTADPRTYIFYQRCGFRPWYVERDVFTPERGYDPSRLREPNGLVHRDMLWFDVALPTG